MQHFHIQIFLRNITNVVYYVHFYLIIYYTIGDVSSMSKFGGNGLMSNVIRAESEKDWEDSKHISLSGSHVTHQC